MTEITMSELKMIFIELVVIGIIGVFMYFYVMNPIPAYTSSGDTSQPQIPSDQDIQTNSTRVSATSGFWLVDLISDNLGLPIATVEIIIVSSIIIVPLTIMNGLTALRLIADFLKGII